MWKKLLTLYLLFGVSLAILIVLALYAFQRFNSYIGYADAVDRNHEVISKLNELKVQITEGENNQRAFMLFNDSSFYHRYTDYVMAVRTTFNHLHSLLVDDEQQRSRLRVLNMSIKSHLDYLRSGMTVGYPITDYRYEKAYMDKSLSIIAELEDAERTRLDQQVATRKLYESATPRNFQAVFVVTLIIFACSFFLLVNQFRSRASYQDQLEKNILELNQANAEWEQLAYVASHDLQEPLRKIRTFSDMLSTRFQQQLDDDGKLYVQRIEASSARAQSLLVDIVNYNLVVSPREEKITVDLNESFKSAMDDLRPMLEARQALVEQEEELPALNGYASQIRLLFKSLLDNSLKFSKPEGPLRITLSSTVVQRKQLPVEHQLSFQEYHKIVYQDNGIGFDNEFADKIFKMFQRLHPHDSQYNGRGIGLAIVRRIVTNHMGLIVARGRPGRGAKFTMFFPVQ